MKLTAPSRSFFNLLLQCTHQKNLPNGIQLHAQILKTGFSSCIYISNSLVNFYAKCQHLTQATLVFNDIEYKDVVSWNCLINGYSQQGGLKSSIFVMNLFKRMMGENTLPNAHTFAGIFTACSNLSDLFGGQQAHALAIKMASCSDVFIGSSMLNMYCKSGLVHDARKVFDRMPERNSVSWATMISGYAIQRLAESALGVFKSMIYGEEEGVNEFVFTSVLSAFVLPGFIHVGKQVHCLALKMGLLSFASTGNAVVTMYAKCGSLDCALRTFELSSEKNSITWSAMITGYAHCGDSENSLKLFSSMHFSGMSPSEFTLVGVLNACSDSTADIVLWTSMIGGYVQNGENEVAMSLYCRMQTEGILPNELTMVSVLRACASLAALEQGKQIHTHTIKFGFGLEVPIGSALSTMYAKCGSLEDGSLVFRRIPDRDVVSWNSIISGLSHNGHGIEALELFEEMLIEGTKPDHVTFVNILSACSHMGLVEQGWSYFRTMSDEFGIVPRVDHYACMVDILSRAGKLNEAKEFIESASIDHGMCLWRILISACRNYHNYGLGAYAGEKLMELGSQESSAYVLLSSIYTALGRREDVERVRRMMNLRGVSKEPGCSWIELQSHVHVFVVGDQMHPQIKQIRAEVGRLSKLMKDEGYQPASDSILAGFEGDLFLIESALNKWSFPNFCSLSNLEFPDAAFSFSQLMMSLKTMSVFSGNSPYVSACHIPGYNLKVLSELEADSYRSLLTDGSVTLSSPPCTIRKGNETS